jgi:hypothetical protein
MPAGPVREIFPGFIRLHIFCHVRPAPVYGDGLMRESRRRGYAVEPGGANSGRWTGSNAPVI